MWRANWWLSSSSENTSGFNIFVKRLKSHQRTVMYYVVLIMNELRTGWHCLLLYLTSGGKCVLVHLFLKLHKQSSDYLWFLIWCDLWLSIKLSIQSLSVQDKQLMAYLSNWPPTAHIMWSLSFITEPFSFGYESFRSKITVSDLNVINMQSLLKLNS